MGQAIPEGAFGLADVETALEVLRIRISGGYYDHVIAVDKTVVDEQRLQFAKQKSVLF